MDPKVKEILEHLVYTSGKAKSSVTESGGFIFLSNRLDPKLLLEQVEDLMKHGYRLIGGVHTSISDEDMNKDVHHYSATLIKIDE